MNKEIKMKIINLYRNKKLAAADICEELKKEDINIGKSSIGKFLTKEKKVGRINQLDKQEFKKVKEYLKKVKIYNNFEKRIVHNIIRKVSNHDKEFGQKTKTGKLIKASKSSNYKILFMRPQSSITFIPNKYQGIQYYKNKNDAQDALNARLELTNKIEEKRIKLLKTQNGKNGWGFQKGNHLGK